MVELENAWNWREKLRLFAHTDAVRIFYGPGEGSGRDLEQIAIDRFGSHYWITYWESGKGERSHKSSEKTLSAITSFLRDKGAASIVELARPERSVPSEPRVIWGNAPTGRFEIQENGAKFWIQLVGARHPGLFLDHLPLRNWLRAHSRGWRVLNTFAYTGSLSIAAGLGGATHVTTLDLSNPTIQWARKLETQFA